MILLIDNYDSFTYNIARYFIELGEPVEVVHNDHTSISELAHKKFDRLVISPGPGVPKDAGVTLDAIRYFSDKLPILGVCLGHQAIGEVFGGEITHANQVMHGKTCAVQHQNLGVFSGLPSPFNVTRYNSLVIDAESLPAPLKVSAWHKNGAENPEIMGVMHRELPVEGVQFHPESILSENGYQLFENFLKR